MALDRSRAIARDVAREADVSISAVSRTFTEGASVSAKTREKVMKAAEKLGYRRNALARSLMTQRSDLVGIISNNFRNPAFMEIFNRFTLGLQEKKLRPLIINLSGEMDHRQALDLLIQYQVDGVIIASSTLPEAFSEACIEARLPTVMAFGRGRDSSGLSSVSVDNVDGGRIAADLLVERGCRHIGFIGGPAQATTTVDRLRGFRERLKENNLEVRELCVAQYAHADGMAAAGKLLATDPDIDAIFCGDDIIAMGVSDYIRSQSGRRIPEDIGVLGFNDIAMAGWPAYNLTTIRQPIDEITANAVEMICARIESPSLPVQTRLVPCAAVIRGTLREPVR